MAVDNLKPCSRCGVGFDTDGDGHCVVCYTLPDAHAGLIRSLKAAFTAQGKIAAEATAKMLELEAENKRLRKCVVVACRSGKFGNPEAAAANIIERSFPRGEGQ